MLNGCIQIAKELSKYTAKVRKNGQFLVGGNIVGIFIHFADQKVGQHNVRLSCSPGKA